MKANILLLPAALLLAAACALSSCKKAPEGPQTLILETDMGNDIDDALALALCYKGTNDGKINLALVSNHKASETASAFIDMMNTRYGYPDVPVAKCTTPVVNKTRDYTEPVVRQEEVSYPVSGHYDGSYPDPVVEYRRILSSSPNRSVVVVSLGFGTALAQLLESGPDEFSRLSGRDLVKKKVKYLSIMAGSYGPEDDIPVGGVRDTLFDATKKSVEYNVRNDIPAMQKVFAEWPSPIYQNPFQLGIKVLYPGEAIWTRPGVLADSYRAYKPECYDRPSWDVLSVAFVLRPDLFTVSDPVTVSVDEKGYTNVVPGGNHRILTLTRDQIAALTEYETVETASFD